MIVSLVAVLLLHSSVTYAQYQTSLPHQIAPPPPSKIGCYAYTKETGWQSTPCANSSQIPSMGPLPTLNSTKRFDIHVGIRPGEVAVNPNTNMVYVTNVDGNSVSVISGLTNKTVGIIPVGENPVRLAINPSTNMIYVSNTNSQSVSVISGDADSVVATIPVGSDPQSIAINHRTNMIYIENWNSNTISVIDGNTNKVVATLNVCNLWSSDLVVDESANTIYVTCTGPEGKLDVISGTTNQLVGTIPVGRDPDSIAFNPKTNMLYTANNGDYTVSVVSTKSNKLVDTIHVGTFPEYLAVNPDTSMIYVVCFDNSYYNKLYVISGATNQVVTKIDVGNTSDYVAVDSSDNIIYVANRVSETLSVISGNTNTAIDTIPVGPNPSFIAINNVTKTVYISNFYGTVSMIPFSNLDLQTVPEFSFAIPILLVSIASLIVFYRIKIVK